jgi:hypothetical protein
MDRPSLVLGEEQRKDVYKMPSQFVEPSDRRTVITPAVHYYSTRRRHTLGTDTAMLHAFAHRATVLPGTWTTPDCCNSLPQHTGK